MKARSNSMRGASTLEILLAFTILTLGMAAAARVVYGNQYASLSAELHREALSLAKAGLEDARAQSRFDLSTVVATTSTRASGGVVYTTTLEVSAIGLFLKQATSTVSWVESGRTHQVALSTFLGDPSEVQGGSTCSSVLVGNWQAPHMSSIVEVGSALGGNPVTSMRAFNKKLYLTTSNTSGHNQDFYIFSLYPDPAHPTLVSSLDANATTAGLYGVAVASTSSGVYAFVANAHSSNWSTCAQGPNCAQVQVIDVTHPEAPVVVRNIKMPGVLGSGGQGVGNVLSYRRGYVYVGLAKTGGGPEFLIFDVGASLGSPTNPVYVGSYSPGRGVSYIVVSHSTVYITTSDPTREVIALDVHAPSSPVAFKTFNAPGSDTTNFGLGNTLALVGSTLFLGRNYIGTSPELYMLDAAQPSSFSPLASLDVGIAADPESINGLVVRDNLLFMITTRYTKLLTLPSLSAAQNFDLWSSGYANTAVSCEENYVYVGGYRTSDDKGIIYTLYAD